MGEKQEKSIAACDMLAAVRRSVSEGRWRSVLGLGLYFSLTTFIIQYPSHLPEWTATLGPSALPISMLPVAAYGGAFAVAAALFALRQVVPRGRPYFFTMVAVATFGIALAAGTFLVSPATPVVAVIMLWVGLPSAGAAVALLGIEWMRVLGTLEPDRAFAWMVLSSFEVGAIFVGIDLVPPWAAALIALLFPGLSAACLRYPPSRQAALFRHGMDSRVSVPWKLAITVFVQGLVAGSVQVVVEGSRTVGYLNIEALAVVLAALVAVGLVAFAHFDFNGLLYVAGFPLIALGCVALIAGGSLLWPGLLLEETGNRFIMIMNWTLSAWIIRQQDVSANWVYPCVLVAYLLGRQTGVLSGALGAELSSAIVAVLLFVVLMCSVLMLADPKKAAGWGGFRMVAASANSKDEYAEACAVTARTYRLTPRESEVLLLLARGRNRSFIMEELSVSSDTVKSHMRRIYAKAGVHSQQELMSLVESVQADLSEKGVSVIPDALTRLS